MVLILSKPSTQISKSTKKWVLRLIVLFQHKEDGNTHHQGGQGGEAAKLGGAAACQPGEQNNAEADILSGRL